MTAVVRLGVVREQSLLAVGSGRCLTVVDRPEKRPARATAVIAHGLTGDRSGPAELLSRLSARLCRSLGLRVVRFDFRCAADSSGEFEAMTFAGMTSDFVEVAARHAEPGRPVICSGISIGGVPAAVAAHRLLERGDLAMAGVVLMSSDLIEGVRFATEGPTAIRGGEFHLPETFFREREELKPRTLLIGTGLPYLLIYGSDDAKVSAAASWFAGRGGHAAAVEGDHLFQSARARSDLFHAWAAFVRKLALPGNEDPS